jgi:hypothetical protein
MGKIDTEYAKIHFNLLRTPYDPAPVGGFCPRDKVLVATNCDAIIKCSTTSNYVFPRKVYISLNIKDDIII